MESSERISAATTQRRLIRFAAKLGTSVCSDDVVSLMNSSPVDAASSSATTTTIGREAQLLVDFSQTTAAAQQHEPLLPPPNQQQQHDTPRTNHESILDHEFSFTCPSLSLLPSTTSSGNKNTTTPSDLLSRKITVNDKDALRLNSEAMAWNLLRSFQTALEWRRHAWIHSLRSKLVEKELSSNEDGDWKTLLRTPEARILETLKHHQMDELRVVEARTSFRVSRQRWPPASTTTTSTEQHQPARKKARLEQSAVTATTAAAHVLSFQCVLHLVTPAGYSKVTLEAPGIIQGVWNKDELVSVGLDIDTNVLTKIMEQSCRFLVRSSVESYWETPSPAAPSVVSSSTASDEDCATLSDGVVSDDLHHHPATFTTTTATRRVVSVSTDTPTTSGSNSASDTDESLVYVTTPVRRQDGFGFVSPTPSADGGGGAKTSIPLPDMMMIMTEDDHDDDARLVSPAPSIMTVRRRRRRIGATLKPKPTKAAAADMASLLPLVSPPPPRQEEYLSTSDGEQGPSLPALLEVACAAIQQEGS